MAHHIYENNYFSNKTLDSSCEVVYNAQTFCGIGGKIMNTNEMMKASLVLVGYFGFMAIAITSIA